MTIKRKEEKMIKWNDPEAVERIATVESVEVYDDVEEELKKFDSPLKWFIEFAPYQIICTATGDNDILEWKFEATATDIDGTILKGKLTKIRHTPVQQKLA